MTTESKKNFLISIFYVLVLLAIIYVALKYALNLVMPFFIAFICSALLYPIINWLHKKLKWNKKVISVIITVLFFCTIGVALGFIIFRSIVTLTEFISTLPDYYLKTVLPALNEIAANLTKALNNMGIDFDINIGTIGTTLYSELTSLVSTAVSGTLSFVTSIPNILLMVVITIISTFFTATDFDRICKWVLAQFSSKVANSIIQVKDYITKILFRYIRSYALILFITFAELFICLLITHFIAGLENYFLLSVIIAIFDILPIVGTGTVLIPWSVISFIIGDYPLGICLILTYVIIFLVRQVIEPKIVGKQVGIHPLATLIGMIVGSKLFGVIGLFGLPITFALLKDLNDNGKIHIFKPIQASSAKDASSDKKESEESKTPPSSPDSGKEDD